MILGVLWFGCSFVSCMVIMSMLLSLIVWFSSCALDWMPFMFICRTVRLCECDLFDVVVLLELVWLVIVFVLSVLVCCFVVVIVLLVCGCVASV